MVGASVGLGLGYGRRAHPTDNWCAGQTSLSALSMLEVVGVGLPSAKGEQPCSQFLLLGAWQARVPYVVDL